MHDKLMEAARLLVAAKKTIAFTGAGVSTESGIPDFRSKAGLWSRYDPSEYATLGAFMRDPGKVWNMLAELDELIDARPNEGHKAMAELESSGVLKGIITQNVDGLHQAAGSREVVAFHGSARTYTCITCHKPFTREAVLAMPRAPGSALPLPAACPQDGAGDGAEVGVAVGLRNSAGGLGAQSGQFGGQGVPPCKVKPDVVLFDEMIPPEALAGSQKLLAGADLVLVVGTSCEVYPANEIPTQVRNQGGKVIEINLEPAVELNPNVYLQGPFSTVFPALVACWKDLAG